MIDRRLAEDVLYAFSVEPKHDRQTLENYLRRYPELAEELIDLSHELRLVAELGESEVPADAPYWHSERGCRQRGECSANP